MTEAYKSAADLISAYESQTGERISAPVNLDKLASFLGITVKEDSSLERDDIIGQICFENETPVVSINPLQNNYLPRRRFTLAHEIGHYCLHTDKVRTGFKDNQKTMSRSESYWDIKESEANGFAAQLLMPKDLIIQEANTIISAYRSFNGTTSMPIEDFIRQIAYKFSVSSIAMEYRLKNLGIIK